MVHIVSTSFRKDTAVRKIVDKFVDMSIVHDLHWDCFGSSLVTVFKKETEIEYYIAGDT